MTKQKSFFSEIMPSLKGCWLVTLLCPVFMLGEVVLEVLIPMMMGEMIDKVQTLLEQSATADVVFAEIGATCLLMVIMSVVSLGCGFAGAALSARGGTTFARNLRNDVFSRIQSFSFYNIDKFQTSSLVTRCTTDVTNIQMVYTMLIRICFRAPSMLIFATIMAFVRGGDLAWIFAVSLPVLGTVIGILMLKAYPRFSKMLKKFDKLNENVQENLTNIRVVKSFVREETEKQKFFNTVTDVMNSQYSAEILMVFVMPIMQLVMYMTRLAMVGIGGNMILIGSTSLTVGALSSLLTYTVQILSSLMMIAMILVNVTTSRASAERLDEIFKEVPDITGGDSTEKIESGSISFKNVNFAYAKDSDNYVLSDVNLEIKSGETVGIIGGTGEGKSTLVQLIARLYDVSTGEVLVDGRNVKDYPLKTLRDAVAMVLQKNLLFSVTIEENMRWGNPDATQEQIEDACKKAQAHDFVTSFPDGYQTELGQGGVNVSGGQKQRLCIARALLKDPKIIILDDSTSAVDTATDEKIRYQFEHGLKNVTKIIIAQRIASIQNSDKIVVIDNGKIADVGNHDQLIERCEIYQEVFASQVKGKEEGGDVNG